MAWRPALGSSLVLRAATGLYRSTNVYLPIASLLAQQPPFSTTFNVARQTPANPLTLANGFTSCRGATTFTTFAVDPDLRVATAHNWEGSSAAGSVVRITFQVTYLGTKGTHLMQQFLPNTYPAGAGNPCPAVLWAFVT